MTEIFMPSNGPSGFGENRYYSSRDEYVQAVAEAMRVEYLGIVDAGFILQIDDPWLIGALSDPTKPIEVREKTASQHVEIVNQHCGIPEDRFAITCYRLNHGPLTLHIDLRIDELRSR